MKKVDHESDFLDVESVIYQFHSAEVGVADNAC